MRRMAWIVAAVVCVSPLARAQDEDVSLTMRDSVVKIFSTFRQPSLDRPWSKDPPEEATGSGFVIDGERIVTNAHMVQHASQIFIQPPKSSDKLRAEVVAVGYGIDLAVLRIRSDREREEFHGQHAALTVADHLPRIGSTVQAIGFPMGGEQQSITEGVVSRVEFTGYNYNTPGLRIQVDAALNPGNSGGPVVMDGEVVGVVFSGIQSADNIGYVIPTEELEAFLSDIADGTFDGRPRTFLRGMQTCENPALRDRLGLTREQTGLVFTDETDAGGEVPLQPWDVVDRIGDEDIDNAGLITLGVDLRLGWAYLIPKLAEGGHVPLTVIRDGQQVEVSLPVGVESDQVIQFMEGGYPDYFICGPIVFSPVYTEHVWQSYLPYLANVNSPIVHRISDEREFEGEELVVVPTSLLPHPITKGYEISYMPVLKSLNGTKVKNLAHLVGLVRDSRDEYLEFEFYDDGQEVLVFNREELLDATEEILEDNGIRNQMSDRLRPAWEN